MSLLALLVACTSSQSSVLLPPSAPGVVLTATTTGTRVEVNGTIRGEQTVDLDSPTDTREAFRYQILDGSGAPIYERTTNGPVLVDAFLDFWGAQANIDVLGALPTLGRFQVTVPLLPDGDTVRFQLRNAAGVYEDAGTYDLSRVESDDLGLLAAVTGTDTLHSSGPSENRLDIVLIGDGFTTSEMGTFRRKADGVVEELLAREPFASYASLINIHRVDVVSAESGASFDCPTCGVRDTAFGSIFPVEAINRLSGNAYDSRAIFQTRQWEVAQAVSTVPWDMVIVLVNTDRPAGMAIHYATATTGWNGYADTAVHELGHTLGLLGDEYATDFCIRDDRLGLPPNITDDPQNPPWSHWIAAGTDLPTPNSAGRDVVGAFSPAYNCEDLYRPQRGCAMNAGTEFCPVCAEQLVRRILQNADPIDAIELDGGKARAVGPLSAVTLEWSRNGKVFATSVPGESVRVGSRPFEVRARVLAPEVLDGTEDLEQVYAITP
ncbi:MAG: M64 family metallopeptidase [Myxococcota bacterium]